MGEMHFMLTMLEQKMLNAAAEGHYETYMAYYKNWEEMNGGRVSDEKFEEVICLNLEGNLLRRLIDSPNNPQTNKIIKHILDNMAAHGLNLDMIRYAKPYAINNHNYDMKTRVHIWADKNQAAEILEHPLVKEEMLIDEIENLVLNNKLADARTLVKKTGIRLERAFHGELINDLIKKYDVSPDDVKILDSILADLIERKEIEFYLLPVMSALNPAINLASLQAQFPKIAKTAACQAVAAAASLAKESYGTDEQHLVALRLIDEHLEGEDKDKAADLATGLLNSIIAHWEAPGALTPVTSVAEKEAIVLDLLNRGAEIPFTMAMPGNFNGFYSFMLRHGMTKVAAHPSVIEHFKHQAPYFQNIVIDQAGKFHLANAPSATDLAILATLSPYAKKKPTGELNVPFISYMTPLEMVTNINNWMVTPHDADAHQRFLKAYGLLLKHDLVQHVDEIQPGSHTLNLVDAQTGAPYDLYKFIKDNPALNHGFMKPKRDEELLSLYALTKALIRKENRSPELMKKINLREGFQVVPKEGQPLVYNRYQFKEEMNRGPKDIRTAIMSWVDPGKELSQQRRQKTADRLETLAISRLAKEDVAVSPIPKNRSKPTAF